MNENFERLMEKFRHFEAMEQTPEAASLRKGMAKIILKFYRLGAREGIIKKEMEKYQKLQDEIIVDLLAIEKEIPIK